MKTYTLKQTAPGEVRPVTAAAPREHVYPDTRRQVIGAEELRRLGMASALAFAAHRREIESDGEDFKAWARRASDTVKDYQDKWRHGHVKHATGGRACRLREVARADYNDVQGHFLNLAGLSAAAFESHLRGAPTRHGEPAENGRQSASVCAGVVRELEAHFAAQVQQQQPGYTPAQVRDAAAARCSAYVAAIERGKFAGARWESLPSNKQWQMVYTLRGALNRMTGRGEPANRNKKQRNCRTPRTARAESAQEENRRGAEAAEVRSNNNTRHFVAGD